MGAPLAGTVPWQRWHAAASAFETSQGTPGSPEGSVAAPPAPPAPPLLAADSPPALAPPLPAAESVLCAPADADLLGEPAVAELLGEPADAVRLGVVAGVPAVVLLGVVSAGLFGAAGAEVPASGTTLAGDSAASLSTSEPHATRASNSMMLSMCLRIGPHYAQSSAKVEHLRDRAGCRIPSIMTSSASRSTLKLSGGTQLSFVTAGDSSMPAVLLIHGFPSSSNTFRDLFGVLSEVAYVIAPDLPGFGASDVLNVTTFDNLASAVSELLAHLKVRERFIYLHDFGAPVGFRIARDQPELVRGLIVQNANAHQTGFGPGWQDTMAYWLDPTPDNEAAATAHLTLKGVRDQYIAGVPDEVARTISPAVWEEDWRVMCLPGRLAAHRALIKDYAHYVETFDHVARYLREQHPPTLMVWGRHDIFFELAETLSFMQELPRMEAHILDGGHFLLETHAQPAGAWIRAFIERNRGL